MPSVLDKLNQAKKQESPQADVADRMYQTLMSDIELRAQEKARKEIQTELEGARAETARVIAERDAARLLQQTAESISSDLRERIVSLEKENKENSNLIEMSRQQLSDNGQVLKSELSQERIKSQNLELQIARLEGKLSEKSEPVNPQVLRPLTMPELNIIPIRGVDGRIASAKITPVNH